MTETDLQADNNGILANDQETIRINKAVKFINDTARETIYEGSIKIGEYILNHFFDNNIKLASSRNPMKKTSFNELCKRDDLTIKAPQLAIMVRVAAQEQYLLGKK